MKHLEDQQWEDDARQYEQERDRFLQEVESLRRNYPDIYADYFKPTCTEAENATLRARLDRLVAACLRNERCPCCDAAIGLHGNRVMHLDDCELMGVANAT